MSLKLSEFDPISLDEPGRINPSDRVDTKFLIHRQKLNDVLNGLTLDYRMLTISDRTNFTYKNQYIDTPEFRFYLQHHNGLRPRYKFRFRQYVETNRTFFEIKEKTNKNRTIKYREEVNQSIVPGLNDPLDIHYFHERIQDKIMGIAGNELQEFRSPLSISFSRSTLCNVDRQERITIDYNLVMQSELHSQENRDIVILEVKQPKYSVHTPIMKSLVMHAIPETKFSKYTYGIMSLYPVKYNRFKPRKLHMHKLIKTYQEPSYGTFI